MVGCQLHLPYLMLLLQLHRLPFMFCSLDFELTLQFGDHYILGCHLHPPRFMLLQQLLLALHGFDPASYSRYSLLRALCVAFYKCPFRLGAEFATCMNAAQQSPLRGRHVTLRPEDCAGTPMVAHEHPVVAVFAKLLAEASPPQHHRSGFELGGACHFIQTSPVRYFFPWVP